MQSEYENIVKQGPKSGEYSGTPNIEVLAVEGGVRLMQDFAGKRRYIWLDNNSIIDLANSLEKALAANGHDRAWQRHYSHVL